MGIFRKLFGREPQGAPQPDARIKGRLADFENISRLVDQDRWAEAVAALDRVLGLPSGYEAAKTHLQALLADPQLFRVDTREAGRDAEGRNLVRARLGFGGGSVPQMFALRGRYLLSAIGERLQQAAIPGGVGMSGDPELLRLRPLAIDHVKLCTELFFSDTEALIPAARLCGVFGNYAGSQQLLRQVLQLDPNHAEAKEALAYVERQL